MVRKGKEADEAAKGKQKKTAKITREKARQCLAK